MTDIELLFGVRSMTMPLFQKFVDKPHAVMVRAIDVYNTVFELYSYFEE